MIEHTNIHDLDVPFYTVELVKRVLDGNQGVGQKFSLTGESMSGWDVVVSIDKKVWAADEKMEVKVTLVPTSGATPPSQTQAQPPKIISMTTTFYEIISYSEPTFQDQGTPTRLKRIPTIIKEKQIPKLESSNPLNQSIDFKIPKYTTSNIVPPMNGCELNGPDGVCRTGGGSGGAGGAGSSAEIEFEIPVFVSSVKREDCEALRGVVKGL
ncbi:hypothetical protein HDU76_010870 [Blyttiomyces sp. JEL0837]|nr:hypothetical protein HDU76_010870 [Blyttiomyces sp. JEL0837]